MKMNVSRFVIIAATVVILAGVVLISGCTGTDSQKIVQPTETSTATTVQTESAAATAETTQPSVEDLEWKVWREGSNTLNALGGYFVYSPNVNGQKFKALKVQVTASGPVTVLFFNDTQLSNFEKKMSTNSGDFTPIERYDNVNYKEMEVYSDDYLNVVILNTGDKLVTADFNIWYKNIV
ncbi:hypothetical protein J2128_002315 [Methanomicrobium sp. W14]|uniref:hypothetical protein n=1 Tax=Methanomicrobium sp. W14 TaxID=2817839 RepID=UPI001AE75951|nr:hypothetical protein [Methanomicrobium sp. W14]MBP2134349.1 hypothetical protein [Methanomicrobium sp. W14]